MTLSCYNVITPKKKTMKQSFLFLLLLATTPLLAQTPSLAPSSSVPLEMRDVFRQMPDSILPYLTETNRLDMIDFIDSHMKSRVQNKFEGYSEMLALSDDSLTIQMSRVLRLTMRIVPTAVEVDGSHQLICLERTIGTSPDAMQTKRDFYSVLWRKLSDLPDNLVK